MLDHEQAKGLTRDGRKQSKFGGISERFKRMKQRTTRTLNHGLAKCLPKKFHAKLFGNVEALKELTAGVRTVHLNDPAANDAFVNNFISTSKYEVWNFLPIFLFEQFSRPANAYFIVIGILGALPLFSLVEGFGRYGILITLSIMIGISGIREVVEDVRRHSQDKKVNNADSFVLGHGECKWGAIRVGNIIRVNNKEHLPADIVLLSVSSLDGVVFVETKNLDGETNLKRKMSLLPVSNLCISEEKMLGLSGVIECDAPNDKIYKFSGSLSLKLNVDDDSMESDDQDMQTSAGTKTKKFALSPENVLVRGSSVQNTDYVYGIVVYAGVDTKLMKNMKPSPKKISLLEKKANTYLLLPLLFQIICTALLFGFGLSRCNSSEALQFWYFNPDAVACTSLDKFALFVRQFTLMSSFVPIGLYVTMELCRLLQNYFITRDRSMYYAPLDVYTQVRTTGLNEENGIVDYIFSDKTGTLTANEMVFQKCVVGETIYSNMPDSDREFYESSQKVESLAELRSTMQSVRSKNGSSELQSGSISSESAELAIQFFSLLALCHTVVPQSSIKKEESKQRKRLESMDNLKEFAPSASDPLSARNSADISSTIDCPQTSVTFDDENRSEESESKPDYQATSPDEAALVMAAYQQGFQFVARTSSTMIVDVFGTQEEWEILAVLEFNSTRKRMSMVARLKTDKEQRLWLFCKGADSVIFERLSPGQEEQADKLTATLDIFAAEGLRTLVMAYAELDEDVFFNWLEKYTEASSIVGDARDAAVEEVENSLEINLQILGATAIEDKLQENVPETLIAMGRAGIKLWVCTGDKQETAINIGLSCGILDENMDVVILNEQNLEDTEAQIDRAMGRWSALRSLRSSQNVDAKSESKLAGRKGIQMGDNSDSMPGSGGEQNVSNDHYSDDIHFSHFGIVVDGGTLNYALSPELAYKFMLVARMAKTVISCRVSPKQKTEIVELVRRFEPDKITLAIGDGANDVGMIQAAHIGIGLYGKEGVEAVLASDFALGRFYFLSTLLFVHGRWCYKRLSKMVMAVLYKSIIWSLLDVYNAFYIEFSSAPLVDPLLGGMYNLLITSLPTLILGVWDYDVSKSYALMFPELYRKGLRRSSSRYRNFLSWIAAGVWHSALIYFSVRSSFGIGLASVTKFGKSDGLSSFGILNMGLASFVVHAYIMIFIGSWNIVTAGLYLLSLLSFIFLALVFSSPAVSDAVSPTIYLVSQQLFAQAKTWLMFIIVPVMAVIPYSAYRYYKRNYHPGLKHMIQELMRTGIRREDVLLPPITHTKAKALPRFVRRQAGFSVSGYNFDMDDTGATLRTAFRPDYRRIRMRHLKRSGSDTELDVAGIKSERMAQMKHRRARSDADALKNPLMSDAEANAAAMAAAAGLSHALQAQQQQIQAESLTDEVVSTVNTANLKKQRTRRGPARKVQFDTPNESDSANQIDSEAEQQQESGRRLSA
uniref:Phospholipid-transporting ATPase n=1 Tax=Timspurckia oligopyrenoides TaxID=708627 RepID=A0A7S0ZD02_9RHOD|mmetsp:Transcript_12911/g.23206  ORF Transcript_12911/g.23206 Transcript_12911/m.23206 type:complete len:1459 (+) Transcript_12911:69-4445(+)